MDSSEWYIMNTNLLESSNNEGEHRNNANIIEDIKWTTNSLYWTPRGAVRTTSTCINLRWQEQLGLSNNLIVASLELSSILTSVFLIISFGRLQNKWTSMWVLWFWVHSRSIHVNIQSWRRRIFSKNIGCIVNTKVIIGQESVRLRSQ